MRANRRRHVTDFRAVSSVWVMRAALTFCNIDASGDATGALTQGRCGHYYSTRWLLRARRYTPDAARTRIAFTRSGDTTDIVPYRYSDRAGFAFVHCHRSCVSPKPVH
jgi:hypothetical protein